jgi:hypothetical protein
VSSHSATRVLQFEGGRGLVYTDGHYRVRLDGHTRIAGPSAHRSTTPGQDHDTALNWQIAAFVPWSKYITGCTRQVALAHIVYADVVYFSDGPQIYSLLGKRLPSVPVPDHDDNLGIFT